MNKASRGLDDSLAGLKQSEWLGALKKVMEDLGDFSELDENHIMTFVKQRSKLIVTFETVQGILSLSETAQPLGFELARSEEWSHLCLISDGDTWFRSQELYAMFDELTDNGFFDDFDDVLFYGAGPCAYAAAAFSVAAPGATIFALQPQATLDPDVAVWDKRFSEMRRLNFSDRYGYAPDMIEAAKKMYLFYDPHEQMDAMHAALFSGSHVEKIKLPFMGAALQTSLLQMTLLMDLLKSAGYGKLSRAEFFRKYRARRNYSQYLKSLMARLDADERHYLNVILCRNVTARLTAPKFARRLETLAKSHPKARDLASSASG
jgi:hypothetical protein